ncbi:MAG: PEGA domain-containing protein, partial [Bacteroidales bacterium]|nr:PEGA domain-containing protein [Bacteroidales bacterium]
DGREIAFPGGFPQELSFVKTRNHLTVHMDSSFERDMDDLIEKHIAPVSAPSYGSNSGKFAKVRVRTDHDCIIKRFDEEIGSAKVGEYSIVYLPKGKHRITFISSTRREVMLEVTHEVTDLEYEGLMEVKLEDVYRKFVEDEEKRHKREQFRGVLKKSWIWIGIVMVFAVVVGVFIWGGNDLPRPEPKPDEPVIIVKDSVNLEATVAEEVANVKIKEDSNVKDDSSKGETSAKVQEQVVEKKSETAQVKKSEGEKQKVGTMAIQSKPSGASVKINGRDYGVTPLIVNDMKAGNYTVEISKKGYEKLSYKVQLHEGATYRATDKLRPVESQSLSERIKEAIENDTLNITHAQEEEFKSILAEELKSSLAGSKTKSGTINGHEYVDLGLPSGLKWATCNVGANSPEEYGDYYAWGEIETKNEYTADNSKTDGKSMSDISGNAMYDVACAKWGGSWRLPTKEEFKELRQKCKWEWTTQNGKKGYKVTGPNGNSIFLPVAGYRAGSSLYGTGERSFYWSSSPLESYDDFAYRLYFTSSSHDVGRSYRVGGYSVRPVSE